MFKVVTYIATVLWHIVQFFTRWYEFFELLLSAKAKDMSLVEFHEAQVSNYRRRMHEAEKYLSREEAAKVRDAVERKYNHITS